MRVRGTSERLLVCVGPSPFSARLVRAAHRMSAVVRGELFAVHVASPAGRRLGPADQERLLQNLRIAESLGARVASIEGTDAASAVVAFAASHDVSRIVVGKTGRGRLHELLHGSFTMDVIRQSRDIDVYAIHGDADGDGSPGPEVSPTPGHGQAWRGALVSQLTAVLYTSVAVAVAWMLYEPPDLSTEALVLILGVVVAALRCGRWPAVSSSLLSAMAFNFLLVEPRFSFAIAEPVSFF